MTNVLHQPIENASCRDDAERAFHGERALSALSSTWLVVDSAEV